MAVAVPLGSFGVNTRDQLCRQHGKETETEISRNGRLREWWARPLVANRMHAAELVRGPPTRGWGAMPGGGGGEMKVPGLDGVSDVWEGGVESSQRAACRQLIPLLKFTQFAI